MLHPVIEFIARIPADYDYLTAVIYYFCNFRIIYIHIVVVITVTDF
jgi:hypothetical protein